MTIVRQLSEYQIKWLVAMGRLTDAPGEHKVEIQQIGRVDETGDLIVKWKQFGKTTTAYVTFEAPKYE